MSPISGGRRALKTFLPAGPAAAIKPGAEVVPKLNPLAAGEAAAATEPGAATAPKLNPPADGEAAAAATDPSAAAVVAAAPPTPPAAPLSRGVGAKAGSVSESFLNEAIFSL